MKNEAIGYNGEPIEHEDNDTLFAEEYVEALSDFILNCSTPMTISLQGEWGIGKTSFYNLIKERNEGKALFIDKINAWEYSQFGFSKELSIAVLSEIVNKISPKENKWLDSIKIIASASLKSMLYSSLGFLVSGLKSLGTLKLKTAIENMLGIEITLKGNKENKNNSVDSNVYKEISSLKKKFEEIINKKISDCSNIDRVVIFIDDLDRIDSENAVELLECLKNFLDVKNCVFILAIDYDVILEGACKKFGKEKGQAFFDKIIKLPFVLPVEHYKIKEYVESIIVKTFKNEDKISSYVSDKPIDYLKKRIDFYLSILNLTVGNNPRSIGRIFNSFYIMYKMDRLSYEKDRNKRSQNQNPENQAVNLDEYAIELVDLYFYYCCIKAKYPKLFAHIMNDIEKIKEKDKSEVENYLNMLSKSEYENMESNEKVLLGKYCEIMKKLNNNSKLSNETLYKIIVRQGETGNYINKI